MGKTVNEQSYKELVARVFADVRQLLRVEANVDGPDIDILESVFSAGQPPTELELKRLEIVQGVMETLGSDEQQLALRQMIEGNRILTSLTAPPDEAPPISHPFFQPSPPAGQSEQSTLTAYDLNGKPVASQNRNLLFSDSDVAFDYETLTGVRSDLAFLSFLNPSDGRQWTVVRRDAKWTRNIDRNSILDSLLLPVLFLGDLGYFPNTQTLTYYERIGIGHADRPSDRLLHGFSIVPPGEDGWVPLVSPSSDPQDGNMVLDLNPAITAENAGPVLANLIAFAETLKQSGIVLDAISLSKIEVDLANGRLRLPADARPVVHNAGLFSYALEEQSKGDEIRVEATDGAVYTPAFAVYSAENGHIFKAVEQQNMLFLGIIEMLAIKSGRQQRPLSYIKAWESLVDLHRYYMSREMKSVARIIRKFGETIFNIIQYYIEVLGQDGLEHFTVQLPLQPLKIGEFLKEPQKWFEFAKGLIDEAKNNAGADIRQYWIDNYDKLWGYGQVLPFRRGGGTPQNPPPAESGPDNGSTGDPTPPNSASGYVPEYDEIEGVDEADLDDGSTDVEEIDTYVDDSVLEGGFAFIDVSTTLPEWAPVW